MYRGRFYLEVSGIGVKGACLKGIKGTPGKGVKDVCLIGDQGSASSRRSRASVWLGIKGLPLVGYQGRVFDRGQGGVRGRNQRRVLVVVKAVHLVGAKGLRLER